MLYLIDNLPNGLANRSRKRINQSNKLSINLNSYLNSLNSCPLNLDRIEQSPHIIIRYPLIRINRLNGLYPSISLFKIDNSSFKKTFYNKTLKLSDLNQILLNFSIFLIAHSIYRVFILYSRSVSI
jgi:hypothetical protein